MLTLTIPKIELGAWMPILGSGIGILVDQYTTLKAFLCDQLAIPQAYVEGQIQTVLVNGQPVDDLEGIHIGHEDIVALSAAMPGLAGTTLRRGGHLAAMRHSITRHCDDAQEDECRQGIITLKLFNTVARDMGPNILSGNFLLKGRDLVHLSTRYARLTLQKTSAGDEEWVEVQLETGQAT